MQETDVITMLRFSKDSSPDSTNRNVNGNFRLLVDFWWMIYFIEHEFFERNHPVTASANAAHHKEKEEEFQKIGLPTSIQLRSKGRKAINPTPVLLFGSTTIAIERREV